MTMQFPLIGKVRQPKPWIIGLVTVGLLGTGGTALWLIHNRSAAPDVSAMTETVDSQPLQVRITASGTVQPIQTVNISPKATGRLAELYVEQGDRVTQGQLLARMENADVEAELAQAQARVAQAEAQLAEQRAGNRPQEISQAEARVRQAEAQVTQAQAQLELAQQRAERNRSLADQGAISSDEFDDYLNQVETAQATLELNQANLQEAQENLDQVRSGSRPEEIAAAEAQLREAVANLEAVQVRQEDTFIRAPFSGIITQKYATEGAFVSPATSASEANSATSTAIVALAEGLEILAEVPEVDISQLRVGQPVEVRADAFPDQTFEGRIKLIAPEAVVQQNVTSFQVRIDLTTGQDTLLSGMNVDAIFLGDEIPSAIVVPTVAIVTKDGETGVLIPDSNNQPQFQPVMLGNSVGDQTQILEGLEPGERIFVDIPANSEWNNPENQ